MQNSQKKLKNQQIRETRSCMIGIKQKELLGNKYGRLKNPLASQDWENCATMEVSYKKSLAVHFLHKLKRFPGNRYSFHFNSLQLPQTNLRHTVCRESQISFSFWLIFLILGKNRLNGTSMLSGFGQDFRGLEGTSGG